MLTELAIRHAKPKEKPYKLYDGRGLSMLVVPTGGRLWRFRYRYGGKEKLLALGTYGFRSMASSLLNEKGWHPDLIELQLAHAERNKVRDAYNRAQRLDERRKMMQDWGDYLDGLRAGASVVPIKRAA